MYISFSFTNTVGARYKEVLVWQKTSLYSTIHYIKRSANFYLRYNIITIIIIIDLQKKIIIFVYLVVNQRSKLLCFLEARACLDIRLLTDIIELICFNSKVRFSGGF